MVRVRAPVVSLQIITIVSLVALTAVPAVASPAGGPDDVPAESSQVALPSQELSSVAQQDRQRSYQGILLSFESRPETVETGSNIPIELRLENSADEVRSYFLSAEAADTDFVSGDLEPGESTTVTLLPPAPDEVGTITVPLRMTVNDDSSERIAELSVAVSPFDTTEPLKVTTLTPTQTAIPGENVVVAFQVAAAGTEPVTDTYTLNAQTTGRNTSKVTSQTLSLDPGERDFIVGEITAPNADSATITLERESTGTVGKAKVTLTQAQTIIQMRGYDAEENELILTAGNTGAKRDALSVELTPPTGDAADLTYELDPGVKQFRVPVNLGDGNWTMDVLGTPNDKDQVMHSDAFREFGDRFLVDDLTDLVADEKLPDGSTSQGPSSEETDNSDSGTTTEQGGGLFSGTTGTVLKALFGVIAVGAGFGIGAFVIIRIRG